MEVVMFLEVLRNILENNPLSEGISHFPPVTVKASGFQRDKHSAIWAWWVIINEADVCGELAVHNARVFLVLFN